MPQPREQNILGSADVLFAGRLFLFLLPTQFRIQAQLVLPANGY